MPPSSEDHLAPPPGAPPSPKRGPTAIYVFLVGLVAPISDIISGHTKAIGPAIALLVGFVVSFVAIVELRRRHKIALATAAFAGMVAIAIIAMYWFGGGWWSLCMYVVATAVSTLPPRWTPVAIGGTAAVMSALAHAARWSIDSIASIALSVGMAGFVSYLLRRRVIMIDELRAAHREVARLAAADAVIDERLRIARDLHDLLGHSLSVIALKSELARRLVAPSPDQATVEIADIEQIARRALIEVREAVTGYRARSLEAELAHARAALEAAGVEVTTTVTAPALPAELDDLLAWIVREATTNVVRHSRARRAEIELVEADGLARLEIRNDGALDGRGSPPTGSAGEARRGVIERAAGVGHGLAGLRERTAEAGGELTARLEGAEFRVVALVPLETGAAP